MFKCWEREDGKTWWQIGKNGRKLFDRSKPTVGCRANGRRTAAAAAVVVVVVSVVILV